MRVAVVHDWLTVFAGAEKVLEQILYLFPEADLFTVVDFLSKKSQTTFIQHLPFVKQLYRTYLPLMPIAIEQFDLSEYDLILSSSHAVAKGVITGPGQIHICYCHTPLRYAWEMQNAYLKGRKSPVARYFLHKLRLWDVQSSQRVDHFIANSHFIAQRIEKCYRRTAEVIYPPVSIENFPLQEKKENYYLTASRLVSYKNVDLLVEAFRQLPDHQLFIIGQGPERKKLERNAPKNVTFLGHVSHDQLVAYMGRARAFLFAAIEDFGIAPLEAQCCGTPVIAYHKGGVVESLGETGIFFHRLTAETVADTLLAFEKSDPPAPSTCRKNAQRFSVERFRTQFKDFITRMINK